MFFAACYRNVICRFPLFAYYRTIKYSKITVIKFLRAFSLAQAFESSTTGDAFRMAIDGGKYCAQLIGTVLANRTETDAPDKYGFSDGTIIMNITRGSYVRKNKKRKVVPVKHAAGTAGNSKARVTRQAPSEGCRYTYFSAFYINIIIIKYEYIISCGNYEPTIFR